MKITTLAALKRAIQPGSRIKCLSHWLDTVLTELPPQAGFVRVVTKTQGNGYWFVAPSGGRAWGDYPKRAADVSFEGDTFTFHFAKKGPQSDRDRVATFQLLQGDPPHDVR